MSKSQTGKSQPTQFPIGEEIAELKRETGMRHGAYPKFVSAGNLSQDNADLFIGRMYSARRRLEALAWLNNSFSPEQRLAINSLAALLPDDQRRVFAYLLGPLPPVTAPDSVIEPEIIQ